MALARKARSWGTALAALVPGMAAASAQEAARAPADEARVAWLRARAVPFATCEAGNGFEDLEPLRAIVGDARIVALGEGTHGTREFFQMKHRLLEFLASELGFTIFSIEASTPEAYELDPYVLGGPGDPKKLIGGMYFWTWNTEEVLAQVEWMRAFNAARPDGAAPLHFTGFDMQSPDVAMEVVTGFLAGVDPERAAEVKALYGEIKSAQPRGGFGVSTGSFPVELARGKRVRFRGWIKTEGLSEGWAGLWWRNDREGGAPGGFDNMADRGPRGTQDWTEVALELEVPEDVVNINFGCIMPGSGKAWFDSLTIELDGAPFADESFDFEFENGVGGLSAFAPGYRIHADEAVARGGARSLCMESLAVDPDAPDPAEAAQAAREILDELEAGRELLLADHDPKTVDWVIHNARIVEQCLRGRGANAYNVRDRSMAENVAWILEQDPGAKIVLWAHNGHVWRMSGAMGEHLAEKFGDDYLPVGFATHEGRYFAVGEGGLGDHELVASPPESVEAVLAASGAPRLVLDLRASEAGSAASGWLREERPFRSIGALAQERQFFPLALADAFDVLVWVRTTAAARQLDTPPGRR